MVNTTLLYSAIAVTVVTAGVLFYVFEDEIFGENDDEAPPSACDSV